MCIAPQTRSVLLLFVAMLSLQGCANSFEKLPSYRPEDGYVPDAVTAARIAEAVWIPIYGASTIASEKPFRVELKNGVWIVQGHELPPDTLGGTAIIEISKENGSIFRVSHGQ